MYSLTEKIILQIFGSNFHTNFHLSQRSPRHSILRENRKIWKFRTPLKTCLICTGTPMTIRLKSWHS